MRKKMPRPITPEEHDLIVFILGRDGASLIHAGLVEEMIDGEMGSLRFVGPSDRRFGKCIGSASFKDADGVPVSAVLNADQNGELFELDIWKADFSPFNASLLRASCEQISNICKTKG